MNSDSPDGDNCSAENASWKQYKLRKQIHNNLVSGSQHCDSVGNKPWAGDEEPWNNNNNSRLMASILEEIQ